MSTSQGDTRAGFLTRSLPRNSRRRRSATPQQTQAFRPAFMTPRQVNSPLNPLSPAYHPRRLGVQDSGNRQNLATPPTASAYALHDQYAIEYPPLRSAMETHQDSSFHRHRAQPSSDHGAGSVAIPHHQTRASEDRERDHSRTRRHQAPFPEQHGFLTPHFIGHQLPQPYEQHPFDSPPFPSHHAQPYQALGLHDSPFAQQQAPLVYNFDPFFGPSSHFQGQGHGHGHLQGHLDEYGTIGFHTQVPAQGSFDEFDTPHLQGQVPRQGSLDEHGITHYQVHGPAQGHLAHHDRSRFRTQVPTPSSVDDHGSTTFRSTALPHPTSFPSEVPPPFGFDKSTSPSLGIQGPLYSSFGSRQPPGASEGRPDVGYHPDERPVSRPFTRLTIPPPGLGFETPGRNPDSYKPRILPLSDADVPQTQTRSSSPPLNAPREPRALRLARGSSPAPSQSPRLGPFGGVMNQPIPYPLASYSAAVRIRSGATNEQELLRGRREGYRQLLESMEVDPVPIQDAITFGRSEEDQSANPAARLEEIVYENEKLDPEAWTQEYDDPVPSRYQPDFDFYPGYVPAPPISRYRSVDFIPTTPLVRAALHHSLSARSSVGAFARRTKDNSRVSSKNKSRATRRATPLSHGHPEPETALALQEEVEAQISPTDPTITILERACLKTFAALSSTLLARGNLEVRRQDRCEAGTPLVYAFLKACYPTLSSRLVAAFDAECLRVTLISTRHLRYIRDVILKESDTMIRAVDTPEELTWLLVSWEEGIERAAEAHAALLEGRKEALRDVWGAMGVDGGAGEMEMAMNVAVFGGVEMDDVPPWLGVFA